MPSLVGNTTNKGYSDTGGYGNEYQSYYQRMLDQQRSAQQAAQKQAESNYARYKAYAEQQYKAYAEQQYKDAMANWQAEQNRQQSLWYRLTQQTAQESTPGLWRDLRGVGRSLVDTMQAGVNRVDRWGNSYQNYSWGQPSSNPGYAQAYGNGAGFTPGGGQYGTPSPGYSQGSYYGKQFTYGVPATPGDYANALNANNQRLNSLIEKYNSRDKGITIRTAGGEQSGLTPPPISPEQRREELIENGRRGYRLGAIGFDQPYTPLTLPPTTPPPTDDYDYPFPTFPQIQYPDFGGFGGYSPSQSASQWYNSMVQWNIGNK